MGASLRGVLELNALFLASGLALVWGLRGWGSWLDFLDTLGIALVLGTCSVGVLSTLVLVGGAGLGTGTIIGLCAAPAAVGLTLGRRRHARLPRRLGRLPALTPGTAVSAVAAASGAVAIAVILVAFFRVARVTPLGGGDSWEFWVPKAKVIYFDGTIDSSYFTSLAGPRYPLFVPSLQAMDFRFMGWANPPELAVQYWLLFLGFVLAAASILRRLVPAWLAWLFVALTGVIPQLDSRLLGAQADWTLDMQFALGALVILWWLHARERWLLAALGILLSALIATKQEGLLLAVCLYIGVAAGTFRAWRRTWPQLLAVGVAAYAVNLPWRIWWGARHLPPVLPTGGIRELLTHLSRVWPSLHLVLRLLLSYDMWLAFTPLALVAALAGLTLSGQARETAVIYLVTSITAVGAFTWILWSDLTYTLDEHQSSTPIPRVVGSVVLLSTVLAPLLIAPLLRLRQPPLERGA